MGERKAAVLRSGGNPSHRAVRDGGLEQGSVVWGYPGSLGKRIFPFLECIWKMVFCLSKDRNLPGSFEPPFNSREQRHPQMADNLVVAFCCVSA